MGAISELAAFVKGRAAVSVGVQSEDEVAIDDPTPGCELCDGLAMDSADARPAFRTPADEARLAALVHMYFDFAWRSLRRLGVEESSIDDATQQLFITIERRLHTICRERERAFVFGTAVRVAANFRRSRHRAPREVDVAGCAAIDPNPSPEELLDMKRARAVLDSILDTMPLELRAVFILAEGEGLTRREIAELCEVPEGTAGSRLRRAREIYAEGLTAFRRSKEGVP